jgi:ABC-type ATPase involved in cell division
LRTETRSTCSYRRGARSHESATTAIRILTTLSRPDTGRARVGGFDVAVHPAKVRRQIGAAAQAATLDELLAGRQNLLMIGQLSGLRRSAVQMLAAELLDRLDLSEAANRLTRGYSGGMRQRLDLAASMIMAPPTLFLDEPPAGFDPASRLGVWEVIRETLSGAVTITGDPSTDDTRWSWSPWPPPLPAGVRGRLHRHCQVYLPVELGQITAVPNATGVLGALREGALDQPSEGGVARAHRVHYLRTGNRGGRLKPAPRCGQDLPTLGALSEEYHLSTAAEEAVHGIHALGPTQDPKVLIAHLQDVGHLKQALQIRGQEV